MSINVIIRNNNNCNVFKKNTLNFETLHLIEIKLQKSVKIIIFLPRHKYINYEVKQKKKLVRYVVLYFVGIHKIDAKFLQVGI